MVKIAVAGGTGSVAREIIEVLAATKKHDILVLSRKSRASDNRESGNVSYATTDYSSVVDLASLLRGCDTVLSFVAPYTDQSEAALAQKHLIDASIKAGVRRFAPSEWASARFDHLPWYSYKGQTRQYLEEVNKDSRVLEYCLFQPGLFTNYLTHPHRSATYLAAIETPFDFGNRRMIVCDGGEDQKCTFTTVRDLANVVAMAIEYAGDWPVEGGIKGSDLSIKQLITLGEKLRGPFEVTKIEAKLLQAGDCNSPWLPKVKHPSIPPDAVDFASKSVTAGLLSAIDAGAFQSNDAWNGLLPDYKFKDAEGFLEKAWSGKP
ncbi:hypothetical protein E8E12_010451 [Didymella heteroderae]|uniref:NmrA-like domain-containing protein n=1 Tax=Didymella heteroderae TaxID=1769908 RepID=A0A9P4WWP8_9PLEO|nr:hypothetical protein E8E12_010451 [Didymella heteroderae]